MSIKKDILLKEIDFINEDIRFWHNLILALLSGLSGLAYLYTQNRLIINNFSLSLISGGIISLLLF